MNRIISILLSLVISSTLFAQTDNVSRKKQSSSSVKPTVKVNTQKQSNGNVRKRHVSSIGISNVTSYSNGILIVKGVKYDFIKVEGGTFTMGDTQEMLVKEEQYSASRKAHVVTLTKNYYIGKTEVTQALWKAVMGNNPSKHKGNNKPVDSVSWYDCENFIEKLNSITGLNFRLPTEAEWEFAARGGNKSNHYRYSGSNRMGEIAWYSGNSGGTSHDVATKQPNELGIYDMIGNVGEWCEDFFGAYDYSLQRDPTGPINGDDRIWRGNGYFAQPSGNYDDRSSERHGSPPTLKIYDIGFRIAISE